METNDSEMQTFDEDSGEPIFSMLRDAASSMPSEAWGSICIAALVRAANADGGILLDRGGVTLATIGIGELEAYEVAMLAMSPDCAEDPTLVELDRGVVTLVCIPLRVDARSVGVAVLIGQSDSFRTHVASLKSELAVLGSALSASAPWVHSIP